MNRWKDQIRLESPNGQSEWKILRYVNELQLPSNAGRQFEQRAGHVQHSRKIRRFITLKLHSNMTRSWHNKMEWIRPSNRPVPLPRTPNKAHHRFSLAPVIVDGSDDETCPKGRDTIWTLIQGWQTSEGRKILVETKHTCTGDKRPSTDRLASLWFTMKQPYKQEEQPANRSLEH